MAEYDDVLGGVGEPAQAMDVSPESGSGAPSLAARAAGSSVWSVVGQVFQVGFGLVSVGLLSRWLTPADYGLLGMAATVSGFLGVVGDSGITNAVMRLPKIDATAEATAFWLSFFGATILTLIACVAAPILAWFYKTPLVTGVSVALAFSFLLAAPMRVSAAKMAREMRFRETTIINIVSTSVATTTAIILAIHGHGVWALVAQGNLVFVVQSMMFVAISPPKTSPRLWSRARARDLGHVGSRLAGFSVAMTIGRALDTVLTARVLGPGALGVLGMAMRVVYQPVDRLSVAMYSVFLPATIELGDDARQGRAFKSALRLLLLIIAPFSLGTMAVAPEIVMLLPAKWAGLAPVLRVFALTSLATPLGNLSMSVLVAHGRTSAMFRMAVAFIPVCWAAAILGAFSGSVVGMAIAYSISTVGGAVVLLILIRRRLALGRDFLRAMLVPIVASAIMAAGVVLILDVLGLQRTRVGLLVGALSGVVLYGALAWLMMRTDLVRAGQLLRESVAKRRKKPAQAT